MRFLFIVQGEGKGHMMQSVALQEILEKNGHEIIKVLSGKKAWKKQTSRLLHPGTHGQVPVFFLSPAFIVSRNRKGINLIVTFLVNIILIPVYIFESFRLAFIIRSHKPDAVINFYDVIGGIAFLFTGSKIRKYVISHHFFFEHPNFTWPENRIIERKLLLLHSWMTSLAVNKKLALSFNPAPDLYEKKLFVVPPLIRKNILKSTPENKGFIHIYTLHPGYVTEIQKWCMDHPGIKVRLFSDFRDFEVQSLPNLEIHPFEPDEYQVSLIMCSRVVCTAGFETLAEAAFLGKPLQVIPTENHFEQYCNSLDLERSGLGSRINYFVPPAESSFLPGYKFSDFKNWAENAERIFLSHLIP